jgi:hypothetical protein
MVRTLGRHSRIVRACPALSSDMAAVLAAVAAHGDDLRPSVFPARPSSGLRCESNWLSAAASECWWLLPLPSQLPSETVAHPA